MNRMHEREMIPIRIAVIGGCLLLAGCGIYSFSGSTIPGHIKTVAVPLFEDATAEIGIDQQITDAVIEALVQDNTLRIADARGADSILRGKITSVSDRAGQYDSQENASDFRITLTIQVAFEDVGKRTVFWEETFSQWGSYDTNRDDGIQEAIEKLTTEILNRTVSDW